jgi:hypothetical protein
MELQKKYEETARKLFLEIDDDDSNQILSLAWQLGFCDEPLLGGVV